MGEPVAERIRASFDRLLPASAWREVLALGSGLLTFLCTAGGLFVVLPAVQSGVVAGIAVGLVARRVESAAVVGGIVGIVGSLAGPANAWFAVDTSGGRFASALLAGGTCALVATLARWSVRRWPRSAAPLLAAAVLVLVGNLWYATYSANSEPLFDPVTQTEMPSFDEQLQGSIPPALAQSDDAWFYRVYERVGQGDAYYPAFARALEDNPRWAPASVMDFRMPTLFWMARVLGEPGRAVAAFLVLASLSVLCAVPLSASFVRAPLALPGCAALAAYFVYFPIQLTLFSPEAWAVTFGIGALTAGALSVRSARWRLWTVAAVSSAVVAVLIREMLVFLAIAGVASAFAAARDQRRFRLIGWLAGSGALAAAYVAHYLAARPYLRHVEGFERTGKGSLAFMIAAFDYATDFLGQGGRLPAVLAALGVMGALLVPDAGQRLFVLLSTLAPLASFLVLGNRAWYETTGAAINYWGATVTPLLYALVPTALLVIPGAAAGTPRRLR